MLSCLSCSSLFFSDSSCSSLSRHWISVCSLEPSAGQREVIHVSEGVSDRTHQPSWVIARGHITSIPAMCIYSIIAFLDSEFPLYLYYCGWCGSWTPAGWSACSCGRSVAASWMTVGSSPWRSYPAPCAQKSQTSWELKRTTSIRHHKGGTFQPTTSQCHQSSSPVWNACQSPRTI